MNQVQSARGQNPVVSSNRITVTSDSSVNRTIYSTSNTGGLNGQNNATIVAGRGPVYSNADDDDLAMLRSANVSGFLLDKRKNIIFYMTN